MDLVEGATREMLVFFLWVFVPIFGAAVVVTVIGAIRDRSLTMRVIVLECLCPALALATVAAAGCVAFALCSGRWDAGPNYYQDW